MTTYDDTITNDSLINEEKKENENINAEDLDFNSRRFIEPNATSRFMTLNTPDTLLNTGIALDTSMTKKSSGRKSHAFNIDGGDLLRKMGASWFASYWSFENGNTKELSWQNCKTYKKRISVYEKTRNYHDYWRKMILTMEDGNLNRNKLGLTAKKVKDLVK